MNEVVKRIIEENLESRKNKLQEIDAIIVDVDSKKSAYEEAKLKLEGLGNVEELKQNLSNEIEEIQNELFPKVEEVVVAEEVVELVEVEGQV